MQRFLSEWRDDFADVRIIVVEDNPEATFAIEGCDHYSWRDIDAELGDRAWIIPRRTSACRSYGFLKALQGGADLIWTLDDDCYPEDGLRGRYLENVCDLFAEDLPNDNWYNTLPFQYRMFPRGYPYGVRDERQPVMVHHGLWSSHPDFDGMTQKANPEFRLPSATAIDRIPTGKLFPMCVMNLAFRAEMVPAMYMLLMGCRQDGETRWSVDRFDDIWAGLFVKRICDHFGYAVTSGWPSIRHSKASNADTNIRLEAAGVRIHEGFWRYVRDIPLTADTVAGCYWQLATAVACFSGTQYWRHLGEAMGIWADLTEKGGR